MSGLTARTSRGTAGECCKTDNWLLTTDCRLQSSHRMDPTLTPAALRKLRRALLAWYDQTRRELPWRRDADPYRVWVSEIMLQQTRVAAVVDHYARFLKKFPTVQTLAAARESSVLALWSGLGYYHRARRMHQAAKLIARQRRGIFPRTAEEWRELPGIGRYTAAAIASIAFGEAVAVVDGNVERVVERMFGAAEGREAAWRRAEPSHAVHCLGFRRIFPDRQHPTESIPPGSDGQRIQCF